MGKVHRFSPRWQQSSRRAPPSSAIRDQHHFICKDRGAQADSHTSPNRSKLGPSSSDFRPHASFARQHDHCLFLEKLSWMLYLSSYSRKWPDLRGNLWEGHIRVLRAFVHKAGHTEHTHTPDPNNTTVSTQTHTHARTQHTETIANEAQRHRSQTEAKDAFSVRQSSVLNWGCEHLHGHVCYIAWFSMACREQTVWNSCLELSCKTYV